ncbi:MAG: prepilin-type N-terminal cleavage/methylation domain-containing protein, partial [Candidatus Omnitrophica bacterium]|nr:prepilin-type N-terminal cleavage/methylation domain-containing protein [Candidatus Omnitrophota bacterium]
MWRRERAFTLIELLIVIAIILILIAIALPNFLEAQIRAKVANVSAELKTIETAVTSYRLERGFDPADGTTLGGAGYVAGSEGNPFVWSQLTTPVQYLTSIPIDEFLPADYAVDGGGNGSGVRDPNNNVYRYYAAGWR